MRNESNLGIGIGLRTTHFGELLERKADVSWFEAVSENFFMDGGRPLHVLEHVRRDYPVVFHGVSMSIGTTDPIDDAYLAQIRELSRRYEPPWVSDHLCWTGAKRHNLHDLLPLPWNEEVLAHVVERVTRVQDALGRRLVLENVSSYLAFSNSTMSEAEFLVALAETADCQILLDVNNVYVSAFNHRFDAAAFIDAMPAERVVQLHLAGHSDMGTHLLDTHDAPVCPAVWELYRHTIRRLGPVPTLIEWDGNVPPLATLEAEVALARAICSEVAAEAKARPGAKGAPDRAGRTFAA
ncbi:MAG: DUF692 domain-containing protein [Candidatus Binatia bacterium]|nr:DUF692 domain-containing protein [Candidatus Binatia bacterium]